jgi:hypothetical protein
MELLSQKQNRGIEVVQIPVTFTTRGRTGIEPSLGISIAAKAGS